VLVDIVKLFALFYIKNIHNMFCAELKHVYYMVCPHKCTIGLIEGNLSDLKETTSSVPHEE